MIVFNCIYKQTLYRNAITGKTLFSVSSKEYAEYNNSKGEIVCSGLIPTYVKGVPLKIQGTYNKHKKIVNVLSIEEYSDNIDFTIAYLSSGIFKGIGKKTAEKIVKLTGPNIFEFVERENALDIFCNEISSFDYEKTKKLFLEIKKNKSRMFLFNVLSQFGITFNQCDILYNEFKENTLSTLKQNPYRYGNVANLSFPTKDFLAKYFGISAYNAERLSAITYEILSNVTNKGNSFGNLFDLQKELNYIIKNSAFTDSISLQILIPFLDNLKGIYIDKLSENDRFYLSRIWNAENNIAIELLRLENTKTNYLFKEEDIEKIENKFNIEYSESQRKSFDFLKTSGVKILTGGPGTGKSTVLRGLIEIYKNNYPNNKIALCAPTGRAAQRMSEVTGYNAATIHRLLEYKITDGVKSSKNKENPLDADMIIVDEVSMVDTEIFSLLLSALKNNSLLILCGDTNQLPSVSSGNVLNDLIKSNKFEVNILNVVYRQKNNSSINLNSINIINGNNEIITDKNFELIQTNANVILEKIIALSQRYGSFSNPFQFQVLTSTKKGMLGTHNINKELQSILNHSDEDDFIDDCKFKLNDKVIMKRNNYDAGYCNGDIGIVSNISEDGITVNISNEDIFINNKNIPDVSLAYAITTHKSQGTEYDMVVVVLPQNPVSMLERKLLYTAITRAKKKVIVLSEGDAINKAILNNKTIERKTSLIEKINAVLIKY